MSMLNSVFPIKSEIIDEYHLEHPISKKIQDVLILGELHTTYKRWLAFQAAVSTVTRQDGCHVLYVTNEQFTELPVQVHGMPTLSAAKSDLINITYITSYDSLVEFLSAIHMEEQKYSALVVDNMSSYIDHQELYELDKMVARLLALLRDVADYFSQISDGCKLLVGCKDGAIYRQVGRQFFRNVWSVKRSLETADQVDMEIMVDDQTRATLSYGRRSQQLFLRSVHSAE